MSVPRRMYQHCCDYIVVGAGTAGCVVARRLSDRGYHVLVLEAGGPAFHPMLQIPIGAGAAWNAPRFNWGFRTEPEPGLDGRVIELPRGKVLGGSSSIYMMAHVRGHREDFDHWAALGLTNWGFERMLPYFHRSERFENGDSRVRGCDGPIGVTSARHTDAAIGALYEAANAQGLPLVEDYNTGDQEGIGAAQFAIAQGRRQGAWACYLAPVAGRRVEVLARAHVYRVLLDQGRACAVDYERNGDRHRAAARAGVVLCAGSYITPQLLMLSGIGNGPLLQSLGIECRIHAPEVGRHLQDHLRVAVELARTSPSPMRGLLRWDRLALAMARAWWLRTGPGTQPLCSVQAFAKTIPELRQPDVQILFRLFHPAQRPWFPILQPRSGPEGMGFVVSHTTPKSEGEVTLKSADPRQAPRIRHGYLSCIEDLHTLARGVSFVRALAAQPALRAHWNIELAPGPDVTTANDLAIWIRSTATTFFHPAGTCRMGVDEASVVDQSLQVRGLRGLFVADASVMPRITSGNINAAVSAIAEKASELIAVSHGQGSKRHSSGTYSYTAPARLT